MEQFPHPRTRESSRGTTSVDSSCTFSRLCIFLPPPPSVHTAHQGQWQDKYRNRPLVMLCYGSTRQSLLYIRAYAPRVQLCCSKGNRCTCCPDFFSLRNPSLETTICATLSSSSHVATQYSAFQTKIYAATLTQHLENFLNFYFPSR